MTMIRFRLSSFGSNRWARLTRRCWPRGEALGARIRKLGRPSAHMEVIGMRDDVCNDRAQPDAIRMHPSDRHWSLFILPFCSALRAIC